MTAIGDRYGLSYWRFDLVDIQVFENRKREHIQYALDPTNQAIGFTGLDRIHLVHEAFPDLDFQEIDLTTSCLGTDLPTPFFIAGMTAGHENAVELNRMLARCCAKRGWAMGVGSQRRELESASGGTLDRWGVLRNENPNLSLFANIGISQIRDVSILQIQNLVDTLEANALVVHLNPLQESLQIEGTPSFRGTWEKLDRLCEELSVPVIIKETGCGFSKPTLFRLNRLDLAAVDVSGLGGTHWGRIEGARAQGLRASASETFRNWGESTLDSVIAARETLDRKEIWASGGVRTGLDSAKLIALGAHRIGYAKPALESALAGEGKLMQWMELQEYELRIALFCTGNRTPQELRAREAAWAWA